MNHYTTSLVAIAIVALSLPALALQNNRFIPEPALQDTAWIKGGAVDDATLILIRFTVREQNLDAIKTRAREASDPASPHYGSFLTRAEVAALAAPKAEDIAAVVEWLSGDRSFVVSVDKEVVTLRTTAGAAGALLNTRTVMIL